MNERPVHVGRNQRNGKLAEAFVGVVRTRDRSDRNRAAVLRVSAVGLQLAAEESARIEALALAPMLVAQHELRIAPGELEQIAAHVGDEVELGVDLVRLGRCSDVVEGRLAGVAITEDVQRRASAAERRDGGAGIPGAANDVAAAVHDGVERVGVIRVHDFARFRFRIGTPVVERRFPSEGVVPDIEIAIHAGHSAHQRGGGGKGTGREIGVGAGKIELIGRQAVRGQIIDDGLPVRRAEIGIVGRQDQVPVRQPGIVERVGVVVRLVGDIRCFVAAQPELAVETQMVRKLVIGEQRALDALVVGEKVAVIVDREAVAAGFGDPVAQRYARIVNRKLAGLVENKRLALVVRDRAGRFAENHRIVVDGQRRAGVGEDRIAIAAGIAQICRRVRVGGGIDPVEYVTRGDAARRRGEPILMVVIDVQRHIAAPVGEVLAHQQRAVVILRVRLVGNAVRPIDRDAFVVLLQDNVDRTRDRVRAVDRRTADGNRVDMVDQSRGDLPDVDGGARDRAEDRRTARADEAVAVDQGQRALGAKIIHVHERLAGAEAALGADRAVSGNAEGRQLGQRLADVGVAQIRQRLALERLGRLRGDRGLREARAGDDDYVIVGRGNLGGPRRRGGIGRRVVLSERGLREQRDGERDGRSRTLKA